MPVARTGMTLPRRPPQRKPRGRHPDNALTPAFVRNVSRAGRYCDGNGLYLDVRPTGSRGWIQRLTIRGRRAFANRKLAREGGDPTAEKRGAESMPTFAEAAQQVWKQLRPGWRSPQHAQLWLGSLERYAFPRIGEMPVSAVPSADVIGILVPIWHEKATTARKLRQRIRAVMEWAVAMDLRPDNPCDRIGPVLGAQGKVARHMRALPHGEVVSVIEKVRASTSGPVVKLAFEFLVLTATRSVGRSGPRSTGTRECGPSRPRARRGIASTASRSVVVRWRFSRRHVRSVAAACWCFRACAESRSATPRCPERSRR